MGGCIENLPASTDRQRPTVLSRRVPTGVTWHSMARSLPNRIAADTEDTITQLERYDIVAINGFDVWYRLR